MKIVIAYYILISLVLFCLMGIDKYKAIHRKWRIPEATLLTLAALGGFLGGFGGMYAFRHKIRKVYFHAVFLAAAVIHIYIFFKLYQNLGGNLL